MTRKALEDLLVRDVFEGCSRRARGGSSLSEQWTVQGTMGASETADTYTLKI